MPTVYFAQRADGDIKIGWTRYLENRMMQLMWQEGALKLLGRIEGGRTQEQALHHRFAAFRRSGNYHPGWKRHHVSEWFAPEPPLTWFIEFETVPVEQPVYSTNPDRRVFRIAPPRQWIPDPQGGGNKLAPTSNKVQAILCERFGSVSALNRRALCQEVGISLPTLTQWLDGFATHAEIRTIRKWAAYLDVQVGDILEYVPDEVQPQ